MPRRPHAPGKMASRRSSGAHRSGGPGSRDDLCGGHGPGRLLVDEVDEAAQQQRIGRGQDAMAEIEDVARPTRRLVEDAPRAVPRRLPAGQEASGVEVTLDPTVETDPPPSVGQAHAMVQPDDLSAGLGEELEERSRARPEMDRGYAVESREDPSDVGLDVF